MTKMTDEEIQKELNLSRNKKFQVEVELMVKHDGINYIDAICEYCSKYKLEIESVVPFINGKMKSDIADEGESLNMLIPSARIKI